MSTIQATVKCPNGHSFAPDEQHTIHICPQCGAYFADYYFDYYPWTAGRTTVCICGRTLEKNTDAVMALVQSNGFWHHRKVVCSYECAIRWIESEHLRIREAERIKADDE